MGGSAQYYVIPLNKYALMAEIISREIRSRSGEVILIRSASPQDTIALNDYILALQAESEISVTQPHEPHGTEQEQRDSIEDYRNSPGKLSLVAECGGRIIGQIDFANGKRERIRHVGSFGMSVHKTYRGQGIGKELLSSLLNWARANPLIEKVSLAVFASNERAIKLYSQMGFIEEGRRPREVRFSANSYVDDILMYQFTNKG